MPRHQYENIINYGQNNMSPIEPSNKYCKVIKIQDKDLKIGFVNVIEVLKEKMSNLLKMSMKTKTVRKKKISSRPESGNRINKEIPN